MNTLPTHLARHFPGRSLLPVLLLATLLVACTEADSGSGEVATSSAEADTARWYTQAQVERGTTVFLQHCAQCHGEQAQGLTADWRTTLADGSFPPPPLNGSAHAWHHPLSVLLQVIDYGGADFGGKMPAFEEILSDEDKRAAIAYFQNFWTDEIYSQWVQMGGTN